MFKTIKLQLSVISTLKNTTQPVFHIRRCARQIFSCNPLKVAVIAITNKAKTDLSSTLAISGTDFYKTQNNKMDIIRKDAHCKEVIYIFKV